MTYQEIINLGLKKGISEIELYAKQGKDNVILHIKDNGIGIKKSEISRIFEKACRDIDLL